MDEVKDVDKDVGLSSVEISTLPLKEASRNLVRVEGLRQRIQDAFASLDVPYANLGNVLVRDARDDLLIESKIQDLVVINTIAATLEWLERRGLYKGDKELNIRGINLLVANEVVDILASSALPLEESIVLLNRVCTAGWTYLELDEDEKELYISTEGMPPISYRQTEAVIGKYQAPHSTDVPKLMQAFTDKLSELIEKSAITKEDDALTIASWAHLVLVSIHPFIDANGRTARALVDLVLTKLGVENASTVALDDRLSRGQPVGFGSNEELAQIEAGFIFPESDSTKKLQVLGGRIAEYIIRTPSMPQDCQFPFGRLYHYPGVSKTTEIFSGEGGRQSLVAQIRQRYSDPVVESAIGGMRHALEVTSKLFYEPV